MLFVLFLAVLILRAGGGVQHGYNVKTHCLLPQVSGQYSAWPCPCWFVQGTCSPAAVSNTGMGASLVSVQGPAHAPSALFIRSAHDLTPWGFFQPCVHLLRHLLNTGEAYEQVLGQLAWARNSWAPPCLGHLLARSLFRPPRGPFLALGRSPRGPHACPLPPSSPCRW